MGNKIYNKSLKASDDVEEALKGFVPRFGNAEDFNIVESYGKIIRLKSLAERDEERRRLVKQITKTQGARAISIRNKEKHLVWALSQRKEKMESAQK